MKKLITILLALMLLISASGCAEEDPEVPTEPAPIGSEVWETMPQLTYGVMEYEKLQILPWNSGRCEATSFYRMAETETGYYTFFETPCLEYADKSDLKLWVPVCPQPDCKHQRENNQCAAQIGTDSFVVKNNRIYYSLFEPLPGVYSGPANCYLISIAPNGSDRRFEYAFDENYPATLAMSGALLTGCDWYHNVVGINNDGTYTVYSYRIGQEGTAEPVRVGNCENGIASLRSNRYLMLYGDTVVHNGALSADRNLYFRDSGEGTEQIDMSALPVKFAYLSGDTLRFFRINDGYYDLNIKTGEEVKLADAQLENSFVNIVLPNCILESTLMAYLKDSSAAHFVPGTKHQMRLFDGESWREVALPEELLDAGGMIFVAVQCVTSDSIILYSRDLGTYKVNPVTNYYIIDLTSDELTVEFLMQTQ